MSRGRRRQQEPGHPVRDDRQDIVRHRIKGCCQDYAQERSTVRRRSPLTTRNPAVGAAPHNHVRAGTLLNGPVPPPSPIESLDIEGEDLRCPGSGLVHQSASVFSPNGTSALAPEFREILVRGPLAGYPAPHEPRLEWRARPGDSAFPVLGVRYSGDGYASG